MPRKSSKQAYRQSGVALLVALFALMLLSAIAMAMMFNANTETSMASNYREIQVAQMGAYSGLWEARDRLHYDTSSSSNMVLQYSNNKLKLPLGKPASGAFNVIYIINPSGSETVAPWDSSNAYADTELCQENVLGLSGTLGVPCTGSSSLPSGGTGAQWSTSMSAPTSTDWYTYINDSSYGGAYQLGNALPFKWVRVQLKTDNATTYPVTSSPTGNLVCWDGKHQIPIPSGYSASCGPNTGTISYVTVTSPGTGYTSAPTVSFSGGGGSGAAATANVTTTSTGAVASVTVTNAGQNYATAPIVTFANGGGTGATAIAVIGTSGGQITAANLTSGSSNACWTSNPSSPNPLGAVITSTTGSNGAIQVNTKKGSCVGSITNFSSVSCTFKNTTQTINVTGGSGSGAQVDVTTQGNSVKSVVPHSGGSGYATGDSLSLTGNCSGAISFGLGYVVDTSNPLTITNAGTGYSTSSPPTITIPNPSAAPLYSSGTTQSVGGSGTTTVSSGSGNPGQVIAINVTYGGTGYTSAPTVTITPVTGDPGTNAAATANLGSIGTVTSISVTNAGSGYTSAPSVSLSGGGGSGASATANLTSGSYYGNVFLLTALGIAPGGARYMAQMEAVAPPRGMASTGALTFDGGNPYYNAPNSAFYAVKGNDAASCGSPVPSRPAVGVVNQADVATVIGDLPANNSANYTGSKAAPDVENVSNSLTGTMQTPSGLEAFGAAVNAVATAQGTSYGNNPGSVAMGSASNPVVDYVAGDFYASGNPTGYGILWVTGTLTLGGNFSWYGPIYVVGEGSIRFNGSGNGQIVGTVLAAVTRVSPYGPTNVIPDSTGLGTPSIDSRGGGDAGIQYDHCWADNLIGLIPFTPPMTTDALKIISVKSLPY